MENHHVGKHSICFSAPPVILGWSSVAGKKESEGPFGREYDVTITDSYVNMNTWEQAELKLQQTALEVLLRKTNRSNSQIDTVVSGDLLNQCISSSMSLKNMGISHLGLYGACSTMAESMIVASILVGGDFCRDVVAMTSSHFAASERQFRFPLDYGGQRPPTSQWTVTGSGAVLLGKDGYGPKITSCTIGTVVDLGITDANNMGPAMAPAALKTIHTHLTDLGVPPSYYDYIVTGDLGKTGVKALIKLGCEIGLDLEGKIFDCGVEIFHEDKQDVHAGGSGCGCSAVVLCAHLLDQISQKKLKRILFCGTGALLSPTSVQQKLSIPGICHAVSIEGGS